MFLSMLVTWMFPDVPRSLREQLQKENMVLMEFLLNQDQEACAKSHSSKQITHSFPTNIDIVVEAAPEEQEDQHEDQKEEVGVKLNIGDTNDNDFDLGKSCKEVENGQKQHGGEKEGEQAENEEINEEDGKRNHGQEGGGAKEKGVQINEEKEVNTEDINFTVDIDSCMMEIGLLGEKNPMYFMLRSFKLLVI